jgi:preprotein translocase subunit SecE
VMNANTEQTGSGLDTVKLAVVVALLVAGVYGFYSFADQPLWVRLAGLLAVIGGAVFVALQTAVGRTVWQFAADARTEVRKVVWPTRQETWQTTLVVFVMVLVMAVILWAVDLGLMTAVKAVTGQGG